MKKYAQLTFKNNNCWKTNGKRSLRLDGDKQVHKRQNVSQPAEWSRVEMAYVHLCNLLMSSCQSNRHVKIINSQLLLHVGRWIQTGMFGYVRCVRRSRWPQPNRARKNEKEMEKCPFQIKNKRQTKRN